MLPLLQYRPEDFIRSAFLYVNKFFIQYYTIWCEPSEGAGPWGRRKWHIKNKMIILFPRFENNLSRDNGGQDSTGNITYKLTGLRIRNMGNMNMGGVSRSEVVRSGADRSSKLMPLHGRWNK